METNSDHSAILDKTRALCQAIIDQPDFQTIRQQVDAFMADESIKTQYQELSDRGAMLEHKQQTGTPLDMAFSHNDQYLYVFNGGLHMVNVFSVHADGSLHTVGTMGSFPASAAGIAAH